MGRATNELGQRGAQQEHLGKSRGEVSCRMCLGTWRHSWGLLLTRLEHNHVLFVPESSVLSKLLYSLVLL